MITVIMFWLLSHTCIGRIALYGLIMASAMQSRAEDPYEG